MPKKKPKPFRASKAVKSLARDVIGTPRPTRRAPNKRKQAAEKHKPTLPRMLEES